MLVNTLIVNTSEAPERRKLRNNYLPPEVYSIFTVLIASFEFCLASFGSVRF
jgi:hypothetical protein